MSRRGRHGRQQPPGAPGGAPSRPGRPALPARPAGSADPRPALPARPTARRAEAAGLEDTVALADRPGGPRPREAAEAVHAAAGASALRGVEERAVAAAAGEPHAGGTASTPGAPADEARGAGSRDGHGSPRVEHLATGEAARGGATAAQLRRFIKSRPWVPLHELRRRFGLLGGDDDVAPVRVGDRTVYVGLPVDEARLLGELLGAGDVGYELSHDPEAPVVVGVYPMRPVPRG